MSTEQFDELATGPFHGTDRRELSVLVKTLNKMVGMLRLPFELQPRFDHREDMVSMQQVSNMQHLIERLLDTHVPGAFVELGCYTGSTAAVIASLIQELEPTREFHVYDRFDIEFGSQRNIKEIFTRTMEECGVPLPIIHQGDFEVTLPRDLPEQIAFAHIDCGTGGAAFEHTELVVRCLTHVYPRLPKNAVVIFMDYHVPELTVEGNDSNPGVRLACDVFLADKPEKVRILYGGPCSHAYIRKT